MNKPSKKLQLSRNTIKTLADDTLGQAAGGIAAPKGSRQCSQPCSGALDDNCNPPGPHPI